MRYLLDTNVLGDVRRQVNRSLNDWVADQAIGDLAISAISILEIEVGILQIERRDQVAGQHLRGWFEDDVRPAFSGRILPVDDRVAMTAARLHVPDPAPHNDALVAATAIVHDLTLVTRNVRDFERTKVRLLDSGAIPDISRRSP